MASNNTGTNKRLLASILSFFVVGLGQIFSGRFWTGLWFFIIFYTTIIILKIVWTGINQGFWGILAAWTIMWLYNIFDAYKGANYNKAPCEKECPAGMTPWIYLNQIGSGASWKYPFTPFFKVLGLICPAPCEEKCTRHVVDSSVAIRYLKHGTAMDEPAGVEELKEKRPEKVAIIGAGPCGMSAAYYLSTKGYQVTVYEKAKKAGGIPLALIPEFRLPTKVLNEDINILTNENIKFKYNTEIGKDVPFDNIFRDYEAVFVAVGAWKQQQLGIPGEEKSLDAFSILQRIKNGEKFDLGKVGVIGGGNTAIDVARSLKRLGHDVKIYYRRRVQDMPSEEESKQAAMDEGIEVIPLTKPVGCAQDSIMMAKTECPDGRRGPVDVVKGSEFSVKLDNIVCALGQQPDTGFLNTLVKTDNSGRITINRKNYRTNNAKVYAGGDAVLGPQTLAHAVGHGLEAARQIDQDLRKVPGLFRWLNRDDNLPAGVKMLKLNNGPRMTIPQREASKRVKDFKHIEQVASQETMVQEADRCLTCPLRYRT
jgi:NADPH-dependent glutamate synthase beta subunit-like oxidoreductase